MEATTLSFAQFGLLYCRIALLLTFAMAVAGKAREFAGFTRAISLFGLVPEGWSPGLAKAVLGAESAVVLLIALGGSWAQWGAILAAALLVPFTYTLVRLLAQRSKNSCNCFGRSSDPVSGYHLARNAILMAWAVATVGFGATGAGIGPSAQQAGDPIGLIQLALLVLAAVSSAIIVVNLSNIGQLLSGGGEHSRRD